MANADDIAFDSDINAHSHRHTAECGHYSVFTALSCRINVYETVCAWHREISSSIFISFCVRKHAAGANGANPKVCRRKWSSWHFGFGEDFRCRTSENHRCIEKYRSEWWSAADWANVTKNMGTHRWREIGLGQWQSRSRCVQCRAKGWNQPARSDEGKSGENAIYLLFKF